MINNPKIKRLEDLEIWNQSIDLVEQIYTITKKFPKEELYGLSGQLRRAAISIPSNIAEGFARFHNREYKQFLYIYLWEAVPKQKRKLSLRQDSDIWKMKRQLL